MSTTNIKQYMSDMYEGTSMQTRITIAVIIIIMIGVVWFYKKSRRTLPSSTILYMREIEQNKPQSGGLIYQDPDTSNYSLPALTESFSGSYVQNNMYSYGIWLYVKPSTFLTNQWHHIMTRRPLIMSLNVLNPENITCNPGLFLYPTKNTLRVQISTISKQAYIDVDDIPLNQWFHVVVVTEYSQSAIYINGRFVNTLYIPDTIKDTVNMKHYVNQIGGFLGKDAYFSVSPIVYTQDQVTQLYEYELPMIQSYEKYILETTDVSTPDLVDDCDGACST